MRIVVNDIAASKGGALTVLKDFYRYIVDSKDENEWIFLLSDHHIEETKNIKIIILKEIKDSPFKKLVFDFVQGKKYINALNPDVVFSLQNIITFGVKCPQVNYVHQSLPFQDEKRFSFFKAEERTCAIYQYIIGGIIKLSVKYADMNIVQTEWMRNSVLEKCGISEDRIICIRPNLNLELFKKYNECKNDFERKIFFYPTSSGIYKNNERLIEAIGILVEQDKEVELNITLDKTEDSINNVNYLGRISYQEVIQHYFKNTLVFPSYIETFGYPLEEAKCAGTIILASDCVFSRELLEGYENAYFFNPHSTIELVKLMKRVINGEIEKKEIMVEYKNNTNNWKNVVDTLCCTKKDSGKR